MIEKNSYEDQFLAVSARYRALKIPLTVELELTRRCHMDCVHCYVDHDDTTLLSLAEISALLNELADMGVLQLTLTGGEPFLRPDIWEILEAARRRGFYLRLFTTATHVDAEVARRLHDLALAEVHVSLYAPDAAIHDAITRRPGSFDKSLAGMRHLAAAGMRVWLKSVVLRQNRERILDLVALAEREGFRYQFDTNITPADTPLRDPLEHRLSQAELDAFLTDEAVARALFKQDGLRGMCDAMLNADTSGPLCDIGHGAARIDASGKVQPCSLYPAVDSIRRRPFTEIWRENPELNRLRGLSYERQRDCPGCDLVQTCSPCPAFAMLEHGDPGRCSSGSRMHAISFGKLADVVLDANEEDAEPPRMS